LSGGGRLLKKMPFELRDHDGLFVVGDGEIFGAEVGDGAGFVMISA